MESTSLKMSQREFWKGVTDDRRIKKWGHRLTGVHWVDHHYWTGQPLHRRNGGVVMATFEDYDGEYCFCSNCEVLFAYEELGSWLEDFNYCPLCGEKLEKAFYLPGKGEEDDY